ncbi:sterol desaturase family protein [Chitinophaga agrisoli]|uniref:Sterol desaturase family protein n=1 Tax=Chitinophaga agrisoli TaxID=2607653 RepID=A0A5B2VW58_9BACT|nr:sterol desaturase family protein [Chitinophaga agrisoli]KAA2242984.1 sterol desaturase family protein [Chitinophaga agrisoli]
MEQKLAPVFWLLGKSALRYFVLAGIPFLLFYVFFPAKFFRQKIQQRLASRKDFLREVWYSMQSTLVFTAIAAALLFTPLRQYTRIYDHLQDHPGWYLWTSVAIALVIHDTYFYWMHRLLHHKNLFKLAHVVHHKSTNPSPWSSYSFHLLEAAPEGLVLVVITMILPIHQLGIFLFTIAAFIINVYGHLGYEIMPRWVRRTWLFEVINSSVHHNLHHSKFKGNYGLYFRFWDRVMGTEHPDYVKEYDRVQAQRLQRAAKTAAQPPVAASL